MAEILKENEFETKVLGSDKLVLVDFFATWCMPCKMLAPIIDQVQNSEPEVEVYKVDIDECETVAKNYGVMSIPTLIVLKNGEVMEKMVGFRQLKQITEVLDKYK